MDSAEKCKVLQNFLHKSALAFNASEERAKEAVNIICNWSYAHRCGNGELTEGEQESIVESNYRKMEDF